MALLTMSAIAKALGVPESTARYWRDRFAAYVPTVGEGRGRRYPPEALDVLRAVAELLRTGASVEAVNAALGERFPLSGDSQDRNRNAATTQQDPGAGLPQLYAGQQQLLAAAMKEAFADVLAEQNRELLAELAAIRAEIAALRRPWWRFWRR